jgi:hypothetical protein
MTENFQNFHIEWLTGTLKTAYNAFKKDIDQILVSHDKKGKQLMLSETLVDSITRTNLKNSDIADELLPAFNQEFPPDPTDKNASLASSSSLQVQMSRAKNEKKDIKIDKVIKLLFLLYVREHAPKALGLNQQLIPSDDSSGPPKQKRGSRSLLPFLVGVCILAGVAAIFTWVFLTRSNLLKAEHLKSERSMVALFSSSHLLKYKAQVATALESKQKVINVNAWQKGKKGFYIIGDTAKGLERSRNNWKDVNQFSLSDTSVIRFAFENPYHTITHTFATDSSFAFNKVMDPPKRACCLYGSKSSTTTARLYMICQAQTEYGICINLEIPRDHSYLNADLSPHELATWVDSIDVFKTDETTGRFNLFDELIGNIDFINAREREMVKYHE